MATFSSFTDFKRIASDERQIREVSELIVTEYLENDLSDIFTIRTDIKGRQDIATVTPTEKRTKIYSETPVFGDPNINSIRQQFNPQPASYRDRVAYPKFSGAWTKWLVGDQGNSISFNATQVFDFLVSYLSRGFQSDIVRIALHGSKSLTSGTASQAKNAAKTNVLVNTGEIVNYNIIDVGLVETCKFWRNSTAAQYTALRSNFIDIDKNANTVATGTGDNQQYNLETNYARNLFDSLVYDGTINIEPNVIIANAALVQNYERSLTKNNALQSNEDRFISGATGQNVLGYPLVKLVRYDQQRRADFTRAYPGRSHTDTAHFALWANKDNLELAINAQSALNNLRITFPDGADEYVYIKGDYDIDFKFTAPIVGGFRCAL